MKYIVYNLDKDLRLPGEFDYRDLLFSRLSMGRILRMLLDEVWAGDRIAILPTDKWEADADNLKKAGITHDPVEADIQSIVFPTETAYQKLFVEAEDSFIAYNCGSFYEVDQDKKILRFDTLIPLISIDPPVELFEKTYPEINGKWVFEPIRAVDEVSDEKDDLSNMYDVEDFFMDYTDEEVLNAIEGEEIPEDGLWVGDLIGLIEGDESEEE